MIKILAIAVLVLFAATDIGYTVERGSGSHGYRSGHHGSYGQRSGPQRHWQNRGRPGWRGPRHRYDPGPAIIGSIIGGFLGTIFAPPPPPVVIHER